MGFAVSKMGFYRKLIIAGHVNKSCHDLRPENDNVTKQDRLKTDDESVFQYKKAVKYSK